MGYEAKRTEHCGPKRGNGAYWGYRWDAKKESNRIRRENAKREIRDELARTTAKTTRTPIEQSLDRNWTKA
jgi:hypothetical protein